MIHGPTCSHCRCCSDGLIGCCCVSCLLLLLLLRIDVDCLYRLLRLISVLPPLTNSSACVCKMQCERTLLFRTSCKEVDLLTTTWVMLH